ncbi:MAG: motility protein A [Candidatus Neomarinimicrobiota bacterium]|nr:MAG: motility protein A [Candidatus Neomarinimicrobiota bacterium]
MDLATIVGILSGLGLIMYTIVSGGNLDIFIHIPSFMIVGGGTIAAILVNFPLKEVIGVIGVVRKAFTRDETQALDIIDLFVSLSIKARREGILAIDKELHKIDSDFMRIGLEMTVDGAEPETIKNAMEAELNYLIERHKKGQQIFLSLGAYSPAFGMIGTLMGLIAMLKTLDDPTGIGKGMALALITTFYGALAANLIFLPIAGKLKNRSDQEVAVKEMIIEGVLAIQYGEHPKNINRKLLNFVSPKLRINNKANAENPKKK